ncbi:zinc-ribbon domain-containing protein [Lactiplantibacillus mudanjiangensis]|uniref:Zinc-ribbon domain-containing protein n=2 Tax=Lactiplantibacillus mudanjiangensis TaxID=1296538 RepID=A0A660E289_9LACO|nr:zinc ribbon domain-containing protein [Lactiplantibacillus mudanjiangensis]VDG24066.1 hypothetical protein [Lactobacillus kunkeei] [Lactiplantibacillus mudanjiangensis]VDG30246.1 hypothetical protein [Lactobacillus kunkeei] [Lactiplantibacillus mudanjiangensis]VDG33834.1 hypothetical protein [Lactobacillus kunkeei] [Lactiplantibacillus mudanjiangensis]
MAEHKFCPQCGTKLRAAVKLCPKCGFKLVNDTTAQAKSTTQATMQQPATATPKRQTTDGDFNARLDRMMKWITNNWATTIIIVIALVAFSMMMQIFFYHAWIGLIALVAVLVWLYSFAWSNGDAPTSMEQQLRHMTKSSVSAMKTAQQNHAEQVQAQKTAAATEQATAQQATQTTTPGGANNIYVQATPQAQSNGLGTAGFVLALISLLFSWVPGVNFVVWFLGMLFSFIGLFKQPKGLAIAGFIISFIDIIIIIILITVIGSVGAGLLGAL